MSTERYRTTFAVIWRKRHGTDLHQICVEEHLPHYAAIMGEVIEARQDSKEFFQRVIAEADSAASSHAVQLTSHILLGHAVETIVTYAKDHSHLA